MVFVKNGIRSASTRWLYLLIAGIIIVGFLPIGTLQAAVPTGPLDVVFVIDNSGSMRKNDPQFLTPKTVRSFMHELSSDARVAMVLFDQRARLLLPLSVLSDPATHKSIDEGLEQVDYRGKFTDSAAGIERAVYELKTNGRPDAQQSIIFLTDGIVDTGNRRKDAELSDWLKTDLATECSNAGIRILGIAFTEKADYPLIQALATRTGGTYFRAPHAEDIAKVLAHIETLLAPPEPEIVPVAMIEQETPLPEQVLQPSPPPVPEVQAGTSSDRPADTPASTSVAARGFLTFYLPLLLIIVILVGLVAMLVMKLVSSQTPQPAEVKPGAVVAPPLTPPTEWELQDLSEESAAVYRFDKAQVTIGRNGKSDLMIHTPTVSNLHATIEFRDGAFFLEDQRSTNGTRLNDQKVLPGKPVRLKSGDRIKFANLAFKFVRLDQLMSGGDTVLLDITALGLPVGMTDDEAVESATLETRLKTCLLQHLERIRPLGEKYDRFVDACFSDAMCGAIAIQARENLEKDDLEPGKRCSLLIQGSAFYVICTLPLTVNDAADWFIEHHGGFSQFIFKWIKSDGYDVTDCDQFCVITFGIAPKPWVSITVVPTHEEPDPVEIMSVNFLTDDEKAQLGLTFDDHGRVL
jgi:hypothetical protein